MGAMLGAVIGNVQGSYLMDKDLSDINNDMVS